VGHAGACPRRRYTQRYLQGAARGDEAAQQLVSRRLYVHWVSGLFITLYVWYPTTQFALKQKLSPVLEYF